MLNLGRFKTCDHARPKRIRATRPDIQRSRQNDGRSSGIEMAPELLILIRLLARQAVRSHLAGQTQLHREMQVKRSNPPVQSAPIIR